MKIIKHGLSKEQLEKKIKQTKRFKCDKCECVFDADYGEYEEEEDYIYITRTCACPNCGNRAFEYRMR